MLKGIIRALERLEKHARWMEERNMDIGTLLAFHCESMWQWVEGQWSGKKERDHSDGNSNVALKMMTALCMDLGGGLCEEMESAIIEYHVAEQCMARYVADARKSKRIERRREESDE